MMVASNLIGLPMISSISFKGFSKYGLAVRRNYDIEIVLPI